MWRSLVLFVAVGVAVAGCRGDSDKEAVEDYIVRANETHADFEFVLRQTQQAIRAFAAGRATANTAERLRAGSSTIRASHDSLAVIEPPPAARALHADLLTLLNLQTRLTVEMSLAADYTTRVAPAIRPAQAAATTLGRRLRSATSGEQQAAALTTYAETLSQALRGFDALAPPPFLRPWHDDRAARLAASRGDALALAAGIRSRDTNAVERALKAFTTGPPEDAARKAQTEAVRSFNRLLDQQERLLNRIARRQAELAQDFGS